MRVISEKIEVCVVHAASSGHCYRAMVSLSQGSCIECAVRESGVLSVYPELDCASQSVGIWGRRATLETLLRDGDRVEIYRPLQVDPKTMRRQRAVGRRIRD
ncbi:RnfH family protein [Sinimarinibacterium sp. NLF-5-8]|uniref:RnfH family protein n=1 Tax=Sinimarinibacterium sp. NLF-5-8 TaxID=2698684 RepID=UPI00137BF6F6|nr:RnfH family protein [Sinimarinibacterium sp. NLF-5-8]QHS09421.1 RnfH family protein [Sinimarinibacterium sp. NLF-5-8]